MNEERSLQDTFKKEGTPWYFRTSTLVIGFILAGPFMLPLVWLSPRLSSSKKVLWSIVILAFSAVMIKVTIRSLENIQQYYGLMQG